MHRGARCRRAVERFSRSIETILFPSCCSRFEKTMKIEVLTTQWSTDDETLIGGEHEIAKPSKRQLAAIAAAEATGSVRVVEASDDERRKLDASVQSDEDAQKAYDKAQASGSWH